VSLFWRVFIGNAVVFVVGTAALALSPATISAPILLQEGVVLAIGLTAILLANAYLLRRSLAPLERLARTMRSTDLLKPAGRVPVAGSGEVADLVETFNEMLDRLESERRSSTARVHMGQEAERRRVAQELHDEVGQALTAVLLALKRAASDAPGELRDDLLDAQEITRASLEETRRIVHRLRPGVLEDLGLVSALTALSTSFAELSGVSIERRFEGPFPELPHETELALYRVAQESLTNVARHAGASAVSLELAATNGSVELAITDDGPGPVGPEGGGIRGMRERALAVGGELAVAGRPEGGIRVTLRVPAQTPGEER
jgi:two-component system sensor histidine kinase UhpB